MEVKWYYCPGSGRITGHKLTIRERWQMWRRRQRANNFLYIGRNL
jgi:hypothetical protein